MTAPPPQGQFGPDIYATWRRSSLGEITEALEHRLLFDLAGPVAGRAVLDVGCGDGSLALAFRAAGAGRVAGCDADPRMVAKAQAAAGTTPDTTFTVAGAQALPYPDASFDIVTCVTVLTFIPDPAPALREMARVLRPGGRLVIGDLGKWSLWAARRRIRGWFGAAFWRTARFRTAGTLASLIQAAGLRVEQTRGAIFFPPSTAAARLLARLLARWDPALGRRTTFGAAFIAVAATKPPRP